MKYKRGLVICHRLCFGTITISILCLIRISLIKPTLYIGFLAVEAGVGTGVEVSLPLLDRSPLVNSITTAILGWNYRIT